MIREMESESLIPTDFSSDLQSFRKKRRKACFFILASQFFERTAYYALYANLILFLNTEPLQWTSYNAMIASLIFAGVTYVTCLLGGILAESCLSKRTIIWIGYLFYITGYLLISITFFQGGTPKIGQFEIPKFCHRNSSNPKPDNSMDHIWIGQETCSFYLISAFVLVGIGGGLIKAVIAPFGADQIRYESSAMLRTFFNAYYWVVNSGSFIAYLIFAYVQQNVNPFYGYVVPCFLLVLSAFVFAIGIPFYNTRLSPFNSCRTLCGVCRESCWRRCCLPCKTKRLLNRRNYSRTAANSRITNSIGSESLDDLSTAHWSINFFDLAKVRYGGSHHESTVEDVKIFGRIIFILACLLPFWIVYFQMESTYMVQGLHMKLDFINTLKNIKIPAAWLTLFDVITILLILPVMDRLVYPWLDRRDKSLSLQSRIAIGMVFSFASVLLGGVVELYRKEYTFNNTHYQNISGTKYYYSEMPITCQIPQYIFSGLAEVFASVAGLEFAYRNSPKSMQSLVNGIFFFISGVGSFCGIGLLNLFTNTWFSPKDHGNINCPNCHLDYYFYLLGGIQALGFIIFILVSRNFPVKSGNTCLPSINGLNSNSPQYTTSNHLHSTLR